MAKEGGHCGTFSRANFLAWNFPRVDLSLVLRNVELVFPFHFLITKNWLEFSTIVGKGRGEFK